MNYYSSIPYDSKILASDGIALKYPGVTFVLRKMNERRRVKRELAIAALRQKVNEQSEGLQKALADRDNLPPGALDKLNNTLGELLHTEWYPAWIRWGVSSIEGFSIDDAPATIDTLCDDGPTDLVEEAFLAVIDASGLTPVKEKNSQSPGPSEGQADGRTNDSTATGATLLENGKTETAPSSTPAT